MTEFDAEEAITNPVSGKNRGEVWTIALPQDYHTSIWTIGYTADHSKGYADMVRCHWEMIEVNVLSLLSLPSTTPYYN